MPNDNLTPYDTGEVLEPKPWMNSSAVSESLPPSARARILTEHRHEFGMVDFDNEEGGTELTMQIVWNDPPAIQPNGTRAPFTIRLSPQLASRDDFIIEWTDA